MFRKPIVRQDVVGMDEIHYRFVVLEHFGKESHWFALHRFDEKRIDFAICLGIEFQKIQLIHA